MTVKFVPERGTMRELDISWTSAQVDRAMGVLAGMASGDAMGAGLQAQRGGTSQAGDAQVTGVAQGGNFVDIDGECSGVHRDCRSIII